MRPTGYQMNRATAEMTSPAPSTRLKLRVPIRPNVDAVLFVWFPMTEGDWDQFVAVLAAMKPGLVVDLPEEPAEVEAAR